jgi:hypothetical protein
MDVAGRVVVVGWIEFWLAARVASMPTCSRLSAMGDLRGSTRRCAGSG